MTSFQAQLETTLINRAGDLTRLLPEWWALWQRSESATPFQSPAWLLPWWQVFHPGELMTVAVWAGSGSACRARSAGRLCAALAAMAGRDRRAVIAFRTARMPMPA